MKDYEMDNEAWKPIYIADANIGDIGKLVCGCRIVVLSKVYFEDFVDVHVDVLQSCGRNYHKFMHRDKDGVVTCEDVTWFTPETGATS